MCCIQQFINPHLEEKDEHEIIVSQRWFQWSLWPNQEPFCWQQPYWETSCAESRLQWSFDTWTVPVSIAIRHRTSQDVPGHPEEEHDNMQINGFTIHY